ncbi:MAG: CpaF family protein [Hungatella sp.]
MNSDEKDRIRALRERLKCQIREELNVRSQVDDEELCHLIDEKILESGQGCYLPLKEKLEIRTSLFDFFRRLDVLQHAMDDPQITEIMVNGARKIFVEEKGVVRQWEPVFESEEQLEDMIQQLVSQVNRIVNVSSPIVDARMPDGSRLHVVLPPVSLSGPLVTIRKFPRTITMKDMIESGSVSEEAADFLKRLVRARYNLFISGGTNSGKTTFLNALSAWIPLDERVITIEDSAELQIQQVKNLVRLETKNANGEGEGAIGIGDLIRASLRMNPSRIIVGEVRGKEALELLNAYNTGHDGGLSTGHGNSPKDMLARLETMMLMGASLPLAAIRSQIASGLDVMVHLGRLRDKSRRVLRITEVGGYHDGEIELWDLYRFEEEADQEPDIQTVQGTLRKVGELRQKEKLWAAGDFL